jgi:hypothetical protein
MATTAVSRTKRTTPRSIKPADEDVVVDISADADLDDIPVKGMMIPALDDEPFRVMQVMNLMNVLSMSSDDPDETARSVLAVTDMIHPDDRRRFKNAVAARHELSGDDVGKIVKGIYEAATGERPTSSPSGSGRTSKRATSKALSAAS